MDFLDEFPSMDRQDLRDLKKAIDLGFRNFSRAYGDALETFFEPLLYFLVWFEKLFINASIEIFNLSDYGLPQRRKRCIVGDFNCNLKQHNKTKTFAQIPKPKDSAKKN